MNGPLAAAARRRVVLAALLALTLAAAGTGAGSASSGGAVVLTLRKTSLGNVLSTAGRSGRTVYMYTPDAKGPPRCWTGCTGPWRPLLSPVNAIAEGGVRSWLVRLTFLKDGQSQVAYNQHPLYLYAGDSRPGQVKGEGRQGLWFAVDVAGKKVAKRKGR